LDKARKAGEEGRTDTNHNQVTNVREALTIPIIKEPKQIEPKLPQVARLSAPNVGRGVIKAGAKKYHDAMVPATVHVQHLK